MDECSDGPSMPRLRSSLLRALMDDETDSTSSPTSPSRKPANPPASIAQAKQAFTGRSGEISRFAMSWLPANGSDLHQRERVLNSTNHQQRLSAYEAWRKAYEERRVKWLEETNITEEELIEIGYVRERRLRKRGHCVRSEEDRYKVCWSFTGKEIKTDCYSKNRYYEEERMVEIAENVAS